MNVSFKVIGRNLRQIRLNNKLTQEQAAEILNISLLHYGRLERGERAVSLVQLARIAELLNTSIEALMFGASDYFYSSSRISQPNLGTAINSLAAGCSDSTQTLMFNICQVIAAQDKSMST